MDMNRRIGTHLSLQLVIDALKLSPSNPSFLDMRDAILAALDHKLAGGQLSVTEHSTAHSGIWAVFAKCGMGPQARSSGASLSGIVADFRVPTELPPNGRVVRVETAPNRTIPDNQPMGITSDLHVTEAGA